jgi:tetratricopeptide (TPR) repeat protein
MEKENNEREALSYYQRAKKQGSPAAHIVLAGYYRKRNEINKALAELDDALRIDAKNVRIMDMKGHIYVSINDYENALDVFRQMAGIAPAAGKQRMADVYSAMGDYDSALRELESIRVQGKERISVLVKSGNIFVKRKEYEKALEVFSELEKSYPDYTPSYFLQANTLERMGKKAEAVERHEKALERSSDYGPSLNNLAYLYAEGFGPLEKAVDMAKRAKQIAPKDGSITDTLGWTLYKSGNYDEAIRYFKEAAQYLPEQPTIRYHLGLAYMKKGMDSVAEEQLRNALVLGRRHGFPESGHAERMLEGISLQ